MKIFRVVLSFDFGTALLSGFVILAFCPVTISMALAKDLYSVGVSVLSVIFAVFFAALAIIMSAGDNDFVAFLHEDGSYAEIIWSFRFTVLALFVSLLVALFDYSYVAFRISQKAELHSRYFLLVFAMCFTYSLIAVIQSVLDALKYSEIRVRFLDLRKRRET
jgi:hypothetical protein